MKRWRVFANVWKSEDRYVFLPTFYVDVSDADYALTTAHSIVDPFNTMMSVEILVQDNMTSKEKQWGKIAPNSGYKE